MSNANLPHRSTSAKSHPILRRYGRPIAFQRVFVDLTGSVTAALMLSQALYWTPRTRDPDGWFYKTQVEWEEETGMKRAEQEGARSRLRQTTFWQEDRRGVPAQLYFRVDLDALDHEIVGLETDNSQQNHQIADFPQSRLQETRKQDAANPADKNAGIPQTIHPETTRDDAERKRPMAIASPTAEEEDWRRRYDEVFGS